LVAIVNQFLVALSLVVIVVTIARFGRSSPPEAESQQAVATTGTRAADAHLSRRSSEGAEADARARETEAKMTDDERFSLIVSVMGAVPLIGIPRDPRIPADVKNMSAGYTPGIARLGIPALQSSDASMGITNPGYRPDDKGATAFPSEILVGSSFNPLLARRIGEAIAREARVRGFNIVLGGGANLTSEVRNGRNYEYYAEDPWLTGVMAAEAVNGIQSGGVISTLKHYAANNFEHDRHWQDAIVDPPGLREAELLGFQIAIERSQPGAIMCGYSRLNGDALCGHQWLLNQLLKQDWGYKGWVMSDWGAVPSWNFALKGLDQESGVQNDVALWGAEAFTDKLRAAYRDGAFPKIRLSDMVRRILRSAYAVGIDKWEPAPPVDMAAHNAIALEAARQGIVLLKNDGSVLPLPTDRPLKIGVIGGYAQTGVVSGTGSGAVMPVGGYAEEINIGGAHGRLGAARSLFLFRPAPVDELKKLLPAAEIEYDGAYTPAESALLAKRSDVVIVFGVRVEGEAFDLPDLSLPWGQDAIIDAVVGANPNTIVVLETGNPVSMPWRNKMKGIVQAWFPGQAGATAIAEVLTGKVNPSGRTPITWPADLADTPRPTMPILATRWGTPVTLRFDEGGEVGYRWYAQKGRKPMFAFGYGLSYTSFAYKDLKVSGGDTITATFTVTNTGKVAGADVPQVYLTDAAGETRMRLLGFERVELAPGASKTVTMKADPRLLARFEGSNGLGRWRITEGVYRVALGKSADDFVMTAQVPLEPRVFGK
jgi:beta-glucosidase